MSGTHDPSAVHEPQAISTLAAVSNAMVALHKEQFGRGPTRARAHWAGEDAMICTLEDALLPAERQMVELGQAQRVQATRMYFQDATADHFRSAVEDIVERDVWSFASATDARCGVVTEIFYFRPGRRP